MKKYNMNKEPGAFAQPDPITYSLHEVGTPYEHIVINTKRFKSPEEFLSKISSI